MAKKNFNTRHNDFEDDYYDDRVHHDELKQRRKLKRMKNALRARNIEDLLDEDDY